MENICEAGKGMIMMLNICHGNIVLLFSFLVFISVPLEIVLLSKKSCRKTAVF
jgi:hypothetical protein